MTDTQKLDLILDKVTILDDKVNTLDNKVIDLDDRIRNLEHQQMNYVAELKSMDSLILDEVERVHEIMLARTDELNKKIS